MGKTPKAQAVLRQTRAARRCLEGLSVKEIAFELGVCPHHVSLLLKRSGIRPFYVTEGERHMLTLRRKGHFKLLAA